MTAIGDDWKSELVQALLGPAHSAAFPDAYWSGWLDGSGDLIEMTGLTVSHDDWGPVTDGVANIAIIDGGLCPATVPTYFGLFADAEGASRVLTSAAESFDETPSEGDPLAADAGEIVFLGGDEPE
jgi:hypothetical protein